MGPIIGKTMISAREYLSFVVSLAFLWAAIPAYAQQSAPPDPGTNQCAVVFQEVPLASEIATANTWDNLRRKAGSVRAETSKLLSEARQKAETVTPPALNCPADCKAAPRPEIVFSSVPLKFRSDYRDEKQCEALERQTAEQPLTYSGITFRSLEDLSEWFGDFSQGKGREGRDLYKKCSGSCSPQYKDITIRETGSGALAVHAMVECGHARDKGDNQYKLATSYRWRCEPA